MQYSILYVRPHVTYVFFILSQMLTDEHHQYISQSCLCNRVKKHTNNKAHTQQSTHTTKHTTNKAHKQQSAQTTKHTNNKAHRQQSTQTAKHTNSKAHIQQSTQTAIYKHQHARLAHHLIFYVLLTRMEKQSLISMDHVVRSVPGLTQLVN